MVQKQYTFQVQNKLILEINIDYQHITEKT